MPYHLYSTHRLELLKNIFALNLSLKKIFDEIFLNVLLYELEKFTSKHGYVSPCSKINKAILKCTHSVKSVQIRSFFWSVFSRIRTRKSSVFGHFTQCTITPWTFAEENEKCSLIYFSFELKHRAYIYLCNFSILCSLVVL